MADKKGGKHMDSQWLRRHTESIQGKGNNTNKKFLIILPIIFLLLACIVFATSKQNPDFDAKISVIIIIIPFAIIVPIILLAGKKSSDIAGPLRENLEALLTTPELVSEFDYEMSCEPLCILKYNPSNSKEYIFFTEHYIGLSFLLNNIQDYRFARLSDIAEMKFSITRDETKVMGLGKLYFVDLIGSNGEKCLGLSIHGKDRMNEFEETLEKYCPGIKLQEHKFIHVNQ